MFNLFPTAGVDWGSKVGSGEVEVVVVVVAEAEPECFFEGGGHGSTFISVQALL